MADIEARPDVGSRGKVNPDDVAMLEDLVRAAFNQASAQMMQGLQQQFGSLAQDLGIDPSKMPPTGEK